MQNGNPPGWQPQPLPYLYNYPSPTVLKGPESARTVVTGIMNIFFGYIYSAVILLMFSGSAQLVPVSGLGILMIIGLGAGAVSLFAGGVSLLKRNRSGVFFTRASFWVSLVSLLVTLFITLGQVASRYTGQVILSYVIVIFLFTFYPLIAMIVLSKAPEEMGL